MRMGWSFTLAIVGAVTFMSLAVHPHATAQGRPTTATKSSGAARESQAAHVSYIDEESPWVPPPPEPPPELLDATGVLQCVPYARFMSGIGLRGDAWTWWDKAAGIYARGNHPEPGAVLSFPGIERMPLGHVAVVTQVLSARKLLVDHANWPTAMEPHGAISRDVQVVDVSADNDWTEVRVQFGEGGPLGSVYPANGFIYGWTEAGVRIAHPKFSLDYALWSPDAPSLQMFNSIAYVWALPPAERKKAYAAAGLVQPPGSLVRGRPALVLGPVGPGLGGGALAQPLGVNRLDVGPGGRGGFTLSHFIVR
jgi:CHAP domain